MGFLVHSSITKVTPHVESISFVSRCFLNYHAPLMHMDPTGLAPQHLRREKPLPPLHTHAHHFSDMKWHQRDSVCSTEKIYVNSISVYMESPMEQKYPPRYFNWNNGSGTYVLWYKLCPYMPGSHRLPKYICQCDLGIHLGGGTSSGP